MQPKIETEYGFVAAGAASASLAGQLPRNGRVLGPVAAVSYRVASRIANTLKGGWPARSFDELDGVRLILFYSPPEHLPLLADTLLGARINWPGKSLIFCDCEAGSAVTGPFRAAGASVARVRRCGLPDRLVVEGSVPALSIASQMVRDLKLKAITISEGSEDRFDAALTLGSAGLTPLLEGIAGVLRQCGVRDTDSAQLAAAFVIRTADEFAHSGRQSWIWHIREPDPGELLAQMDALDAPLKSLFREMILLGFSTFEKHPGISKILEELIAPVPAV